MPGVTVVRARDGSLPRTVVERALEATRFGGPDTVRRVVDRERLVVATTGPADYPVEVLRTEDGPVVLDGAVYDLPAEERAARLREAGAALRAGDDEALAAWLGARDGEFAVFAADGDAVTLATDPVGGLPCYRATVDGCEVVTREPRVVRTFARACDEVSDIDRLGTAQRLLFGHRLGRRTPFADVERLPPATRLSLTASGDVRERRLDAQPGTIPDAPLRDRIVDACRRRAAHDPGSRTVVPLTGALGPRAVLAGLATATTPFAVTLDRGGTDADADRELTAALGVPWTRHAVRRRPDAERRLFDWTQGTVSLGGSARLPHLDRLVEAGRATVVTGHEPPAPGDGAATGDPLDRVLATRARLPPADAARIVGVDEDRLLASVRDRLPTDPERALARFDRRERVPNGVAPRLDRTRHRCWATDPLLAPSVRDASPERVRSALADLDPRPRQSGVALVRRALATLPGVGRLVGDGNDPDDALDAVLADRVRVCLLTSAPATRAPRRAGVTNGSAAPYATSPQRSSKASTSGSSSTRSFVPR